jgi:hypothetical protein
MYQRNDSGVINDHLILYSAPIAFKMAIIMELKLRGDIKEHCMATDDNSL